MRGMRPFSSSLGPEHGTLIVQKLRARGWAVPACWAGGTRHGSDT